MTTGAGCRSIFDLSLDEELSNLREVNPILKETGTTDSATHCMYAMYIMITMVYLFI